MNTHHLKTEPEPFHGVATGQKTFEIRRDDRPVKFRQHDELVLREWSPESGYTGRAAIATVSWVSRAEWGLPEGLIVMAIRNCLLIQKCDSHLLPKQSYEVTS